MVYRLSITVLFVCSFLCRVLWEFMHPYCQDWIQLQWSVTITWHHTSIIHNFNYIGGLGVSDVDLLVYGLKSRSDCVLLSANWRQSPPAAWQQIVNSCWWEQRGETSTFWTQPSSSWTNTSFTKMLSCRSKSEFTHSVSRWTGGNCPQQSGA